MSSSSPKRKFRLTLVEWIVIIAIPAFLAMLTYRSDCHRFSVAADRKACQLEIRELDAAMRGYQEVFGGYPNGDSAAILSSLAGENPKDKEFLDLEGRMVDARGTLFDSWLTPYQIETNLTNGLSIRSAGPNRRFGDADDLEQSL